MGNQSLSVVVAAWNSPALLRQCLRSLAATTARQNCELIVASPAGRGFAELIANEFPGVISIALADSPTVPQLRGAGLARATGDVVAFTEDHASTAPEWAEALLAAYQGQDCVAAGGPVAQGEGLSSLDLGVYLFDYGRFAPPLPAGTTREISGLNMSFSRALLESMPDVLSDGVFEGPLLHAINKRDLKMHIAPSAIIYQNKEYVLREALGSVFHLGRGYAGRRFERPNRAARLLRAAACPLLPPVMIWRVLSTVGPKRMHITPVIRSVGYLSTLTLLWSIGECVGYLAGSGDSDSRWR
jgi:glycosyltransferase involved in cell wall biosynthesis